MEKGVTIAVVSAIVVVALLLVAFQTNLLGNFTGQATQQQITTGATYGNIMNEFNNYVDCIYVTENDGWDVTKRTMVQYYNTADEGPFFSSDECIDEDTVKEFDCSGGIKVNRNVICPSNMNCVEGACVISG